MVVAVSRAAESGARAVVCASTGNTAASAAAYAARAGLAAIVLTPAGATATAKRAQAVAVGRDGCSSFAARFDDALRICRELGERPGYVLVNSLNPDRIEGQKTRRLRTARAARRRAGGDRAAVRRRRQRDRGRGGPRRGGRVVADRRRRGRRARDDLGDRDPDRRARARRARRRARRFRPRRGRDAPRRRDPERLAASSRRGRHLLRACIGRRASPRSALGPRLAGEHGRLHPDGPRPQGHRRRRQRRRRRPSVDASLDAVLEVIG